MRVAPGIDGFLAGQDNDRQAFAGQLQQLGVLSQLAERQRAQEMAMLAQQKQDAFQGELGKLGPNATSEQMLPLLMRSGLIPPKDLATLIQQGQLKQQQAAATKETAMSRLAQAKAKDDRDYEIKLRNAATAEERAVVAREIAEKDAFYKQKGLDVQEGKAAWEFGFTPTQRPLPALSTPSIPAPPAGSPPAPPPGIGNTVRGVFDDVSLNLQGASPGMLAAARAQPELRGNLGALTALGGSPQEPSPPVPFGSVPEPTPAPANNLDARDLRLASMQSGGVPATAPAPAAPQMPQFVGSPKQISDQQNKWLQDQNKASISGGGTLNPQTLSNLARQYLAGDRQAISGFARSTTARVAIQNAITEEAQKQGLSPEAIASKIAEFAGTMAGSRTVGTRAANISLAANEALQMIDIVQETSAQFDRTNFVPWNKALAAYESGTGRPEVVRFGASLNALVNVYARAINPSGVPTISDKDHAREVIHRAQSPEQTEAVLDIIRRELEIAKKAPSAVKLDLRESVAPTKGTGQWRVVR